MLRFRHGAIPRRVLNTDSSNNSKIHAIFIQIRSTVSEMKHADGRVHYEFNMPTDLRTVQACPLVTVTDVLQYRNIFIFMVEQSQNNPENKNIRQHSCGKLKSRNIGTHTHTHTHTLYIYIYIYITWHKGYYHYKCRDILEERALSGSA